MAPRAAVETQLGNLDLEGKKNPPSYVPRGDVTATVNFHKAPVDGSAPYIWFFKQPEGVPQSNTGNIPVDITIHDIRNSESAFNLDKDAFQVTSNITSAMREEDWTNEETIKSVYYPEVEKLILDTFPGTHKVTLWDHTLRRNGKDNSANPVFHAHVDQTGKSTKWRVKKHNPEDADALLKGRYRIINVWRPINGTIQATPLAFASAATVADGDLQAFEWRYPDRTGESFDVKYNPDQKFYYWSGMDNGDTIFLKCWDSREGVGKGVPHTAFHDHRTPEGAKGRESIEVRALVYG